MLCYAEKIFNSIGFNLSFLLFLWIMLLILYFKLRLLDSVSLTLLPIFFLSVLQFTFFMSMDYFALIFVYDMRY